MIPGEYVLRKEDINCNADRTSRTIKVLNTGDRPIQIGSHFHFYEVNGALQFNRDEAYGMHLDIPAGLASRFEPGDAREVQLVPFTGERRVYGLNNRTDGALDKEGHQ